MHPITPGVRLQGRASQLLYRVITPGHPRGWLDIHAVPEGDADGPLWIHCHGMRASEDRRWFSRS